MVLSRQSKSLFLVLILGAAVTTQYFPVEIIDAILDNSSISDPIDLDEPIANTSGLLNNTIIEQIQLETNATTTNATSQDIIEQSQPNASDVGIKERTGILKLDGQRIPIIYQPLGNSSGSPGLWQGDIIISKEIIGGKAALDFRTKSVWTNGIIPVKLAHDVPNKAFIIKALEYFMEHTPITFRLADPQKDHNYVEFILSNKCASSLGMQGGRQVVHVSPNCKSGNLVHELMHLCCGFTHEQSRQDRDEFVDIIESNIKKDWQSEFKIASTQVFSDYDYCSIMHYPRFGAVAAIQPKEPIIDPKKPVAGCNLGQRIGLSDLDRDAITNLYPNIR